MKNMPRKAISFYEEALQIDDEETDFICNCIGNEYLNLDEVHSAVDCFQKSIEIQSRKRLYFSILSFNATRKFIILMNASNF